MRFPSMYAFAEAIRLAQYQANIPPTALEVAAVEWAAASPVDLRDASPRGPVITTVNKNSRRAARSQRISSRGPVDDRDVFAPSREPGNLRPVLIGGGVGLAVVVVGGALFALATGMF